VVTIAGNPFTATHAFLEEHNAVTKALGLYVSAATLTSFTVSAENAPSASQANTVYSFDYFCIG
jgi:hypothetical protein